MKRTFNYTGRQKIKRERISINFIRVNGSVVSFALDRLDLDDLNLPSNARVYVEAYYRTELKRFDFGTVSNRSNPPSCDLTDLAYSENLKFRVIVVDTASGKILAHADGISPEASAERKSILPVEFKDLGNEIWRVEYEGDGQAPILCINNRITNIQNIASQDSQFLIYVYPAVIREILTHMVFVDNVDSTTEPSTDWHGDWLRFIRQLRVEPPETLNKENDNFDNERSLQWINRAVEAFCNTHSTKFQEYLQRLQEEKQ